MNKLAKNWKRDKIKSDVIKGKQHFAHKSAIRFSKPNEELNAKGKIFSILG